MSEIKDLTTTERFELLAQCVGEPVNNPPYLEYLHQQPDREKAASSVAKILRNVIRRDPNVKSNQRNGFRSEAELARFFYRGLGADNDLDGAASDLVSAARIMYDFNGHAADVEDISYKVQIDSANALLDVARTTDDPNAQRHALVLGWQKTNSLLDSNNGATTLDRFPLTAIRDEISHASIRLRYLGNVQPIKSVDLGDYRQFEDDYKKREVESIIKYTEMFKSGTGMLLPFIFEKCVLLDLRATDWKEEKLDTTYTYATTSRQDAEWLGDDQRHTRDGTTTVPVSRLSTLGNHDIRQVMVSEDGTHTIRKIDVSLKPKPNGVHRTVEPLTYADFFGEELRSLPLAAGNINSTMAEIRNSYF